MPTVADAVDAVLTVDTHADTHTAVLVDARGVLLAQTEVAASDAGHQELITWAFEQAAPGSSLLAGLEGTASYGARLARTLTAVGLGVVELEQPTRRVRRGRGKTDRIDALLGAHALLAMDVDALPTPRAGGDREALRLLMVGRVSMTEDVTAKINSLVHVLRTGSDSEHGTAASKLTTSALRELRERAVPEPADGHDMLTVVRAREIHRLAAAVLDLRTELATNKADLTKLLATLAPVLTDTVGIGPVSAAQVVLAFSHPGRVHSADAFAALAGACPLPASSGRTTRHRLNRGGDRQLNRALHTIALTRMRHCPRTQAYVARRTAEGKTHREIRRILKTYIARELYKTLNRTMSPLDNT